MQLCVQDALVDYVALYGVSLTHAGDVFSRSMTLIQHMLDNQGIPVKLFGVATDQVAGLAHVSKRAVTQSVYRAGAVGMAVLAGDVERLVQQSGGGAILLQKDDTGTGHGTSVTNHIVSAMNSEGVKYTGLARLTTAIGKLST